LSQGRIWNRFRGNGGLGAPGRREKRVSNKDSRNSAKTIRMPTRWNGAKMCQIATVFPAVRQLQDGLLRLPARNYVDCRGFIEDTLKGIRGINAAINTAHVNIS
jgi:hypothetical protein